MSEFEAVGLWIGLHVALLLALKINVGRARNAEKVNFGDGGREPMQRAIRVQGNAVEDVPIILLGLLGIAIMGGNTLLIHGFGAALLVSRTLHSLGLGRSSGGSFGRLAGTIGSLLVQLGVAGTCIWLAVT
ncbi:MAG: MAPEG family protein [Pseudomonadota bacterium]